jgi:S1-C subfamily serine protease
MAEVANRRAKFARKAAASGDAAPTYRNQFVLMINRRAARERGPTRIRRPIKPGHRLAVRIALACLGLASIAAPARAVVGPDHPDKAFAAHVVMVLQRGVNRAGFCTGVVVAPRAVLTAAHCVTDARNMRIHYRDDSGAPIMLEVAAVAVHPGFRADALVKRVESIDLALVETKAPLDGRFSAATLDDSGAVAVGQPLAIVGYGLGREGEGATGGVLRSAALQVRAPLSKVLLWAEDATGAGSGACTGDSGGPILAADGAKVLAITTWSSGPIKGRHCGAVTQGPLIAAQRPWIDGVLAGWRP